MSLTNAILIISIIIIAFILIRHRCNETFVIMSDCPVDDPKCVKSYNVFENEIPPRTSMGAGGVLRLNNLKFKNPYV